MLTGSDGDPLGETACDAVSEGEIDSDEPRELVTVAEGDAVEAPDTEAVSVGVCVELAVLVREPELL